MTEQKHVVIDHVILVCSGCRGERTIWFDTPLVGAEELIHYMKTKLTRCSCGAETCDVKAHMKDASE